MGNTAAYVDMGIVAGTAALFILGIIIMVILIAVRLGKARRETEFLKFTEERQIVDQLQRDEAHALGQEYSPPTLIAISGKTWGPGEGQIQTFDQLVKFCSSSLDTRTPS